MLTVIIVRLARAAAARAYEKAIVDLNGYAGQTVRFRFRAATDSSEGRAPHGWQIDAIAAQRWRSAPTDRIFANGFQP